MTRLPMGWWKGAALGLVAGAAVWVVSGARLGLLFLPLFAVAGGRWRVGQNRKTPR